MHFKQFERVARELWEEIPEAYKAGIDGLIVDRAARARADQPDVFTMGECVTEEYPSAYGGPDTIRSAVVLYYGSFAALAEEDEDFDWDGEIHETIMHELKHHLEALATEDALGDYDYAADQNFQRLEGESFDPLFYRVGEAIAEGMFLVEGDVFLELSAASRAALPIEFEWDDARYRVLLPAVAAPITYVRVEGGPELDGEFYVVRLLRRGALATLVQAFSDQPESVSTITAQAELLS